MVADTLITKLLDLSWIPSLMIKNFPSQEDMEFCLMISFQIIKNKSDIDWKYIQDVLHNKDLLNSTEKQEYQQLLQNHVCKVALNFEADYKTKEYQLSQSYASEASISFTKYTKKILQVLFGEDGNISVGVIYTESQILNDVILLEQEIQYADFAIASVKFTPVSKIPFISQHFGKRLTNILRTNEEYLANVIKSGKNISQSVMIIWDEFKHANMFSSELQRAEEKITMSTQSMYLEFLQDFIKNATSEGIIDIEVISQTKFDLQTKELNSDKNIFQKIISYLFVQESDVNPCMMITMLSKISQFEIETLAVNECKQIKYNN